MKTSSSSGAGVWTDGALPENVILGQQTLVTGKLAFKRFHSIQPNALIAGSNCRMDGVHFALGPNGKMEIGSYCYFSSVVLLCELNIRIGDRVAIGWNTTVADTDFHPLEPAARIQDAIACSPLGKAKKRPPLEAKSIIIEDDVWIGPNSTVLKGVRIGAGAWIEPGSLVTRDVPTNARVCGNPAKVVGQLT